MDERHRLRASICDDDAVSYQQCGQRQKMNEWQPITTAPKDGSVVLTYWRDTPVFAAWSRSRTTKRVKSGRWFPRYEWVSGEWEEKWRVLMLTRDSDFCVHGNYAPFMPTHWMPLPTPPPNVSGAGE